MIVSSESEKERVRDASDIVEVISRFIALKPAGKNLKGLCPFHKEKTPSFFVSPDRQTYKCFGCGVGGDVFEFVMRMENLPFAQALESLAQRAHISLGKGSSEAEDKNSQIRRQIYAVMTWAVERFQIALNSPTVGKRAREYLKKRGLDEDLIKSFGLGFAPAGWNNLLRAGERDHFSPELLEQAGLVIRSEEKNKIYDRFRDRVMFPIWDSQGRPVAFGGRLLQAGEPKYLNSPETAVFQKGELLYGLHRAREAAREKGYLILVEGYMDTVACHRAGAVTAVASLGTALTPKQAQLIKRQSSRVILLYDRDAAGIAASFRAFEILNQAGIRVQALILPEGKDPDEYIRLRGAESFLQLLTKPISMVEYVLADAMNKNDAKSIEGKMAIVQQVAPILRHYPQDGIEFTEYVHLVAERLQLLDRQIRTELQRQMGAAPTNAFPQVAVSEETVAEEKAASYSLEEELVLTVLLNEPVLLESWRAQLNPVDFIVPEYREILNAMLAAPPADPESVEAWLPQWMPKLSAELITLVKKLLPLEKENEDAERILQDCLKRITLTALEEKIGGLQVQIQAAEKSGDMELLKQLAQEKITLAQRIQDLGIAWRSYR